MERNGKSVTDLMRDLVDQVSRLIRHEVGLARAEMSEKVNQASAGATMLAVSLALGIAALVVLLLAAVLALNSVVEPWLSALIVGGAAALVALALTAKGKSNLKARNLMPSRTIDSVREDAQFAKGRTRNA